MNLEERKTYTLHLKKRRVFGQSKVTAQDDIYGVTLGGDLREEKLNDILPELEKVFESVLEEVKPSNIKKSDLVRIYINHEDLKVPIVVTPRKWSEMSAQAIMDRIQYVLSSKDSLKVDKSLEIHVGSIIVPSGSRFCIQYVTGDHSCLIRKRSIVTIRNRDKMCFARALVVAMAKVDNHPQYQKIRRSQLRLQRILAMDLYDMVGMPYDEEIALCDIHKFEEQCNRQVIVFSATVEHGPLYVGRHRERKIYVYHTVMDNGEGHFDAILNIKGCLGNAYFCDRCYLGFNTKGVHRCINYCAVCRTDKCHKCKGNPMVCTQCNRTCKNYECYVEHQKSSRDCLGKEHPSQCLQYYMCTDCNVLVKRQVAEEVGHVCGRVQCDNCMQMYIGNWGHFCSMRSLENSEKPSKYLYFDIETDQSTDVHVPILAVVHSSCSLCEDLPVTEQATCVCGSRCSRCEVRSNRNTESECCSECGKREVIFEGVNVERDMCKWLFTKSHDGATIVSHYGKAFDNYFLLHYLLHDNGIRQIVPQIIFNGSKVMQIAIKRFNIRIIDSHNFLSMPLHKMPKTFELEELKKGFFPFLFISEGNRHYRGPLPERKFYCPNDMGVQRKMQFEQWYSQKVQENYTFDYDKDIVEYCRSDVDILRRSCTKFRQMMMSTSVVGDVGVDPLCHVTIASACMRIYRTLFMEEEWELLYEDEVQQARTEGRLPEKVTGMLKGGQMSVFDLDGSLTSCDQLGSISEKHFVKSDIALVPQYGFRTDRYSIKAIKYLKWLEQDMNDKGITVKIQHALTAQGEKRILSEDGKHYYRVDGYYRDPQTDKEVVISFNGCLFHACLTCRGRGVDVYTCQVPIVKDTIYNVHKRTLRRQAYLESQGYVVKTIWEHEFDKMVSKDPIVKRYVNSLDVEEPLDPRNSFYGGRTEVFKIHHLCKKGERIHYLDFISLYPTINKFGIYPVGVPIVVTDNFLPIQEYLGLVKATLLPPRKLFLPVLPVKMNGKLYFPLCRTCPIEAYESCQCTDDERALTGTWCTLEVQLALDRGYVLQKMFEVYHFPRSTKYDPHTQKGGLFSEYVNKFLKIKQETSGFPPDVKSEEDENNYIKEYFEKEGIHLDRENIRPNKGLRALAKMCLNNLWGKYGQREQLPKNRIVTDGGEFFSLLFDGTKDITDFHILSEKFAQIDYKNNRNLSELSTTTNVFIAIFTTAQARIKLYEVIEKLGRRLIYCDTDSCVYVSCDGDWEPPTSNFLGGLASELTCDKVGCTVVNCNDDHYIEEFVSNGPKNYAYRLADPPGTATCKVRGFSPTHANQMVLNFDTMKEVMLSGGKDQIETVESRKIHRCKKDHKIFNKEMKKSYKAVNDKRIILVSNETIPYGY